MYEREKIINAALYFIAETDNCYMMKLMKLFYFFDEQHYVQTGRTSTTLSYSVKDNGPLPHLLHNSLKNNKIVHIQVSPSDSECQFDSYTFKSKSEPDMKFFTKRERKILNDIVTKYKYHTGTDLSNITHDESSLWSRTKKSHGLHSQLNFRDLIETDPILCEIADEYELNVLDSIQ